MALGDDQSLKIVISAVDNATAVINSVNKAVQNSTASFSKAVEGSQKFALGLTAVATAATPFIYQGVKVAAQLETIRSGFITLLGSAEKADEVLAQIKRDAATTPFELAGLAQANQLLTSVTKDGARSERFLLNVGKALAAMGKGQPELDRIIVNLQQIGAVGKASMLDLKQFAFAGIPIFDLLKDSVGGSTEKLNELIDSGGVTFDMLEQLFQKTGEGEGRFAKAFTDQAGTFNQALSNTKDAMNLFLADVAKESGIFDAAKAALAGLTQFMNDHKQDVINFFQALKDPEVQKTLPIIAGMIFGALVPALIALGGAILAATIPLLPWIAAFGALFWAISNIIQIFDILSNHSDEVVQGLLIMWQEFLQSFLQIPTRILESVTQLWNGIKAGFKDGINFLIGLAEGWANSWVTAVNSIIGALNKIKFSLPSWIPGIGGKSFSINLPKAELVSLPRMEFGGIVPGARGTAVPIMAHGQERILPAGAPSGRGGGQVINVTFNNPQFRSRADVAVVTQMIEDALRDVSRVHKLTTI